MTRPTVYDSPKALAKALRKLPDLAEEHIAKANRESAEAMARDAMARARSTRGVAALVAPAIVARQDGPASIVTIDGNRSIRSGVRASDVMMGAEYGGQGRPSTMQFLPFRAEGYFLGPAATEGEDAAVERASEALADALDDIPTTSRR